MERQKSDIRGESSDVWEHMTKSGDECMQGCRERVALGEQSVEICACPVGPGDRTGVICGWMI